MIITSAKPVYNYCRIKPMIYGKVITKPVLYIMNHHSFLDSIILKSIVPYKTKFVCKSDASNETIFKKYTQQLIENFNVITYVKGDKDSGKKVRNDIVDNIQNGNSVFIFPEGTSYIDYPHSFYPGSFETAFTNNLSIQPITIKYKTNIQWGTGTNLQLYQKDILTNIKYCLNQDNPVNITFHSVVEPTDFNNANHLKLFCETIIMDEWINEHHYL